MRPFVKLINITDTIISLIKACVRFLRNIFPDKKMFFVSVLIIVSLYFCFKTVLFALNLLFYNIIRIRSSFF